MLSSKNKWYVALFVFIALLSIINLYNYSATKVILITSPTLSEQEVFWQQQIFQNPTYSDAYIELVKIKMAKGENNQARRLIRTLINKNPGSPEVQLYSAALGVD